MSVTRMKDGTESGDSRLGRLREFDHQNYDYPIMAKVKEPRPEPRSYTWRGRHAPLDQGSVGACVVYGAGNEALAYPGEVALAQEYAKRLTDEFLLRAYCMAQRRDPWPGTDERSVCGELTESGSNYGGTSTLAGLKVFRDLGFFTEFRWAFNVWEAIIGLGRNGPALVGSWWHEGMYEPDAEGFVEPTGQAVGGHLWMVSEVNVTGVEDWRDGYVTIRNSWGYWGGRAGCAPGEAKLRIRDFEKLLEDDGECAFVQNRTWKPHGLDR